MRNCSGNEIFVVLKNAFSQRTVFTTDEGNEVLVVFQGNGMGDGDRNSHKRELVFTCPLQLVIDYLIRTNFRAY